MTLHLRPHLIVNISAKSRLTNKLNYLLNVMKCRLENQIEDTVLIFSCSQEQALESLTVVKNPTLAMGFEIDFEILIDSKTVKLVGNTAFFGQGVAIIGQLDKTPIMPKLPTDFLTFKSHYTLREYYFRDDRLAGNPKHLFRISTGEEGQSSGLELISESTLAALHAKKQETSYAAIHDNFQRLLLEHENPGKRLRESPKDED